MLYRSDMTVNKGTPRVIQRLNLICEICLPRKRTETDIRIIGYLAGIPAKPALLCSFFGSKWCHTKCRDGHDANVRDKKNRRQKCEIWTFTTNN